jgi:hypothetical protein
LEDQPAGGFGVLAWVEPGHLRGRGDRGSDGAFDQAEDEQGEADHGDQGLDPPVGLEEHRGDREWAFERRVAAFHDFPARDLRRVDG